MLLSEADLETVRAAVVEAEARTSGEIVPYVVPESDDYTGALWKGAALGAIAGPLLAEVVYLRGDFWGGAIPLWLVIPSALGGAAGFLLAALVPAVKRWLAGGDLLDERTRQRAEMAFLEQEVFRTRDRTGILLFLSLFEHRVVVLGDSGINQKVDSAQWDGIVQTVVSGIRGGHAKEALVEAIRQCGELLEKHGVARQADDRNELLRRSTAGGRLTARALRFALLLSLLLPAAGLGKDVPYLMGRVNDYADMIPPDAEQRLEQKLAGFEQQSGGSQIVVLTIESLEDDVLEDFSFRVAQTWKLGQKGKDNGALLLISEQDRKMRIEVGYGLEPELTDLESNRILDDVIRPYFRNGDFPGGIEHGLDGMIAAVHGQEVTSAPVAPNTPQMTGGGGWIFGLIFLFVIGMFSLTAIASPGCQGWFLYLFLMPFYFAVPSIIAPGLGIAAVIAWAVLFPILKTLATRSGWGKGWARPRHRGIFWGGGPFIGGGGGGGWSGGGGGGFSGGGGSFGGGGASGSW